MSTKAPKKIQQRLLPRTGVQDDSQLPYILIDRYVRTYHQELMDMKIAVAWHYGFKPGHDGKMILGQFQILNDLQRQMNGFDGVMLLNFTWWHHPEVNLEHKETLIDHELCHPRVLLDQDTGLPCQDELGNVRYYNRRHDVEEFSCIIERHGVWKKDLEAMAKAMADALTRQGIDLNNSSPLSPEEEMDNLPL